jgi:hypothetical protein
VVRDIATGLLPVFLVLALAYGAGRRKFIDRRNASALSQLVVFAIAAAGSAPRARRPDRRAAHRPLRRGAGSAWLH